MIVEIREIALFTRATPGSSLVQYTSKIKSFKLPTVKLF